LLAAFGGAERKFLLLLVCPPAYLFFFFFTFLVERHVFSLCGFFFVSSSSGDLAHSPKKSGLGLLRPFFITVLPGALSRRRSLCTRHSLLVG